MKQVNIQYKHSLSDAARACGVSRQRVSQVAHGYKNKGYTYPALLVERVDYLFGRRGALLSEKGFNKLKLYFKERNKK